MNKSHLAGPPIIELSRKEFEEMYPSIDQNSEYVHPSEFDKNITCGDIVDLIDSVAYYDNESLTPEDKEIVDSFINKLIDLKEFIRRLNENRKENSSE